MGVDLRVSVCDKSSAYRDSQENPKSSLTY